MKTIIKEFEKKLSQNKGEYFKSFFKNSIVISLILLYLLLLGFYSYNKLNYDKINYEIGKVLNKNIYSQIDFTWVDRNKSKELIQEKIQESPLIYYIDKNVSENIERNLLSDIERINNILDSNLKKNETIMRIKTVWDKVDIENDKLIFSKSELNTLAKISLKILEEIYKKGVIDQSFFIKNANQNIIIKDMNGQNIIRERLIVKEKIDNYLKKEINNTLEGEEQYKELTFFIVKNYIKTNVKYSEEKTSSYKKQIKNEQTYIKKNIQKGEIVAREGEIVDESLHNKISRMYDSFQKSKIINIVGFSSILLVFFVIFSFFMNKYFNSLSRSKYTIFILLIILYFLTLMLFQNYINIKLFYIFPFLTFIIAIYFLINFRISLISLIIFFTIYILYIDNLNYLLIFLLMAFFFYINKDKLKKRYPSLKTIVFFIFFTFVVFIIINYLFYGMNVSPLNIFRLFFYAILNISITFVIAYVLIFLFERFYNITTDINLSELLNWDNPLLKKLMNIASGTYRHSVIVSELSEEAAKAIGADSILSKVGGLYHDVGKIKRANYFIENQLYGPNKHDSLLPIMSVRILKNHVDEGVKIAKKYGLANKIVDIIKEHHGTSIIRFFYMKAKNQNEEVDEKLFRYNGPKPKSKSSAIIFLADKVEAVARVLTDSPFHVLKERIDKIFKDALDDSQLDNTNLTLKELDTIKNSFVEYYKSNLHKRVEYPDEIK